MLLLCYLTFSYCKSELHFCSYFVSLFSLFISQTCKNSYVFQAAMAGCDGRNIAAALINIFSAQIELPLRLTCFHNESL